MNLKSVASTSIRGGKHRPLRMTLCVGALVAVALLASLGSLALAVSSFPDVPSSHPYYTAIGDLATRGVISGYTNGNFGPSDPVRRQQFAKMIVLTGGYPVSEADLCPFTDVENGGPSDLFPDNFVAVCAARGITLGVTATSFAPYAYITRYQVISMVVRTADNLQPGLLANPPSGWTTTGTWGNDTTHGANAARAQYNGLLDGLDLASLAPYGNMTRGEVAQILHNLLVKLGTGPGTTGPGTTEVPVDTYSLATSASPAAGGAVSRSPNLTAYNAGAVVTLTATPATGYTFSGWSGSAGGTTNPLSVTMDANKTIVANFTATGGGTGTTYTLTTSVLVGSGTITRSPDLTTYPAGSTVMLTANPPAGQTFTGWGGNASGTTNPLTVIMDSDKNITASFTVSLVVPGDYEDVGQEDTSGVAVASLGLYDWFRAYVRGSGGGILQSLHQGGEWSAWQSIGGKAKSGSSPAAVCSNSIAQDDVFIRGIDDHLYYCYRHGDVWSDWKDLGVTITSDPATCAPDPDTIYVFYRRSDGNLIRKTSLTGGDTWGSSALNLNGAIKSGSSPACVAWPNGDIHVFIQGTNSHLMHIAYDKSENDWSSFYDTGVTIYSSPAVASFGVARLDVLYRGANNDLYQLTGNGSDAHWLSPVKVSGTDIGTSLDATSTFGSGSTMFENIHVLVRGTNNHLWYTSWDGHEWNP